MMKVLLILCLAAPLFADGPKNVFRDSRMNDELENVYHDIKGVTTRPSLLKAPKRTLAQLRSTTFKDADEIYYCTDCTQDAIVASTGPTRGGIGRLTAKSTAPQ